ncbi:MAG TPA: hypothetical protein VFD31_00040 [Thermoleophilaceae bacterium]|nr:hypothetical protein [Thermoleophilaceae bacterium]
MPSFSHRWLLVVLLALALVAAGCGDDDEDKGQSGSSGDVQTYCKLTRDLDREGTKFFKKLEKKGNATRKDFEKAERDFFEAHQSDLDDLEKAAPEAISTDAKTIIASVRDRAGLGPRVDQAKVSAAEKRIQKFEKRNCK